ncbi:MAG TPA: Xaa-Pro dipeptidase [Gammaproteobacteria bacterium]|nr:Xaa-Pro dipeptidase [Gammaproteobacteria bacterium]
MQNSIPSEDELAAAYGAHLAVMQDRFEKALALAGFDGVVIFAGEEKLVFRDDAAYSFKAEPYFKAWVPLTQSPGSFLRLLPGQRPMLVYRQAEDFWHEPPSDPTGYWTAHFDIRVVKTEAEARKLIGSDKPRYVAIGEGLEDGANADTSSLWGAVNDVNLLSYIDFFRAFKTPYEILCIRSATAVAVRGHVAAARAFAAGASELELHEIYCRAMQQRESELPYSSIVALNEHAAILHYQNLRTRPPAVTRSFLMDAGAQFNGYAADITRTWANATDEFAALIASMETLQQTLCRETRKDLDFVRLHERAHRLLADVLHEHGLITCRPEEALASGITRAFLPHGLGHLLGLQVHDAGGHQIDPGGTRREPPKDHPYLRLTRVLEPGFVVTIEPGLYFIPSLLRTMREQHSAKINWNVVERLTPFGGIRIEDDVEVTTDGIRNLTREAFNALQDAAPGL